MNPSHIVHEYEKLFDVIPNQFEMGGVKIFHLLDGFIYDFIVKTIKVRAVIIGVIVRNDVVLLIFVLIQFILAWNGCFRQDHHWIWRVTATKFRHYDDRLFTSVYHTHNLFNTFILLIYPPYVYARPPTRPFWSITPYSHLDHNFTVSWKDTFQPSRISPSEIQNCTYMINQRKMWLITQLGYKLFIVFKILFIYASTTNGLYYRTFIECIGHEKCLTIRLSIFVLTMYI